MDTSPPPLEPYLWEFNFFVFFFFLLAYIQKIIMPRHLTTTEIVWEFSNYTICVVRSIERTPGSEISNGARIASALSATNFRARPAVLRWTVPRSKNEFRLNGRVKDTILYDWKYLNEKHYLVIVICYYLLHTTDWKK